MISVFKTDVQDSKKAAFIIGYVLSQYQHFNINFDLEDCDKILRIEGTEIKTEAIIEIIHKLGNTCEELL